MPLKTPPQMCTALWLLLCVALHLQAGSLGAFERFDFDQRYLIDPGYIIKDHSVVMDDSGVVHIFYIKADETLPESQRAKNLGHATSTDLKHWTFHPEVIDVVPGTWEESFIWAPHVIRVGSVWLMFYTGVNRYYAQATGLAYSIDLFSWFKAPQNPVYKPDTTWASWSSTSWSNCRDPFVYLDENGVGHLLTTTWTRNFKGAISHATSTDLFTWTDQGPLFVHPGPNGWHVLESANLNRVNGVYHLSFTEQNVGGSSYLQSTELLGPWNYSERSGFDAGHATELFQLDDQWVLSRHTTFSFDGEPRYVIKFDDVEWSPSGQPRIQWSEPLTDWTIWSGDAFYLQPVFWDNSYARGSQPSNFSGNSWIGTYELFMGPLRAGYPGLAAGEEPQGSLRSKTFTLSGNRIKFLIGGGNDLDRLYLALYTADDNVLQKRATGSNSDAMTTRTWNVSSLVGRPVFLEIADLSAEPWGYINVDEIIEYQDDTPTDAPQPVARRLLLHQNFPNPFNPTTQIALELPAPGHARLAIFDARGRWLRTLLNRNLPSGTHKVIWDGSLADGRPAPSGVYFYRLELENQATRSRSMILAK